MAFLVVLNLEYLRLLPDLSAAPNFLHSRSGGRSLSHDAIYTPGPCLRAFVPGAFSNVCVVCVMLMR